MLIWNNCVSANGALLVPEYEEIYREDNPSWRLKFYCAKQRSSDFLFFAFTLWINIFFKRELHMITVTEQRTLHLGQNVCHNKQVFWKFFVKLCCDAWKEPFFTAFSSVISPRSFCFSSFWLFFSVCFIFLSD